MTIVHGFEIVEEEMIHEINTEARLYRHLKSGAELLSLSNDDENKVFGITFRTPPPDSTGIAHIMEHSVLGGSRKYQVKEPFVELLKGSLNTFLNAFTSSDWTAYPVASTNLQDFYNLIDVYLDAVFYPLITRHHLDQEGWHYELLTPSDPLTYKGVVFNEMKGAYSSPDGVFQRYNQQTLFRDHVYGLDSGGDPAHIPDLSYEHFKGFHELYYHPANSRIFFYGDDNAEERLRILDNYLNAFDSIHVDSAIPPAPRYTEPVESIHPYVVDRETDNSQKGRVQVNWLLVDMSDPTLTMALNILSFALVSIPASPLRKNLIDSGLGDDVTGGGLSGNLREMTFGIGLKGIDIDSAPKVEEIILETLGQLARDGLETDMIEAAVNSIEFQLRENNTGRFPRGLSLMLRALGTWLYEGDPFLMLKYEEPLAAVKEELRRNPSYLSDLIQANLLDNPHRATVILKPDPELGQRLIDEEQHKLSLIRSELGDDEIEAIIDNTLTLKKLQETPDSAAALASIPTLTLADLDKNSKEIPIEVEPFDGGEILFHDLFTNGIVYLDAGFDLHSLPTDLLPYVNLFGSSLTRMGTTSLDYVKLTQRISQKTGGIWHSTFTSASKDRQSNPGQLLLRGKSTMSQVQELLELFADVLKNVKLDNKERFRQIVLEAKAGQESGLLQMGHIVVANRLASQYSVSDWAAEQMDGVTYLVFLNRLVEQIEEDWPSVYRNLEAVRSALINRRAMLLNVTVDRESYARLRPVLNEFIMTLPTKNGQMRDWTADLQPINEGLTIPARVNYVGKGANLYDLGYGLNGSVTVINKYLRTSWLWEKIRVQGGAYGGGSRFDRYSGTFAFYSYRDPNIISTIENYNGTADFLRNFELSDEELTKAIIGAIGEIDSYQLPDAKGYSSMVRHLIGLTEEDRQQYRDEILSTTVADFRAFADVIEAVGHAGSVVVLGSPESIDAANEDNWLEVKKVL